MDEDDEKKEDSISINTGKIKNSFGKISNFFKQKNVWNIIIILIFLAFLIWSSAARLQSVSSLKDSTTGEYMPADPDAMYFLRIAETILKEGSLPEVDIMRQPHPIPFSNEIGPYVIVYIYKIFKIFNPEAMLQYVDIIYPVIFFTLGLIAFFFLVYALTKSKTAALLSSVFLSVAPPYLFRTMTGVSDHEPIGMFFFFLTLLFYILILGFLNKEEQEKRKNSILKTSLLAAGLGILTLLTIVSWGGVGNFLFMIIPFSFGIFWLIKTQNINKETNKKELLNYLIFYLEWFVFTILFLLVYGFGFRESLARVTLGATSILTGFLVFFILIDFILIKKANIIKNEKAKKYRVLWSLLATIIIGLLLFIASGNSLAGLAEQIQTRLLHPFGTDRVSVTVSENQQPYLNDWIGQIGKTFFWLFFGGLIVFGINMGIKSIEGKKDRFLFGLFWIILVFGILFSRISPDSIFNGTNFVSQLFYFGSFILFFGFMAIFYFKKKINTQPEILVIFAWTIFMLITARGAVRTFFLITPFACFSSVYLFTSFTEYAKKSKDDLLKMFSWIIVFVIIIAGLVSLIGFIQATSVQTKSIGPVANIQWQNAMKWVRENTEEGSIFIHWWDYGYLVQLLGKRPVLADGGHFEGAFRDHMLGRYFLTNPNPDSALSFMKSNNVSYMLIDPTDIGKYGAFSSIGSDSTGQDRLSYIPIMVLDQSQTQETNNSEIRFYYGPYALDQDIVYNQNGTQIFLPAGRAAIAGFLIEMIKNKDSTAYFNQPEGVFVYNNQQVRIPIRYVYMNNGIMDFKNGLEAGVYLIPSISVTGNQNLQVSQFGAVLYMSPKVFSGLFAQLYLMNDPFKKYPTVSLSLSEPDPFIQSLAAQGIEINEFVFFNGVRGPLKIWKTEYPENILVKEEFLRTQGKYAEFDDLDVTA